MVKNEKFRTDELTCEKVDEHTTRKAGGDQSSYEKATFKNLSETQTLTLKMDMIPGELTEGRKAVVIFVDEQQKLEE